MDFVQVIIFVVIFFRIVMFLNKMRGGNKKKSPTTSVFDTIQKQLKDLEESFETTPTPTQSSTPTKPIPIPEYTESRIPEPVTIYEEAQSSEILVAPYSNLEEGIIDPIHTSKFKHHQTSDFEHFDSSEFIHRDITDDEVGNEKRRIGKNYLKDFDAKKAFIHSIIFERKHFDV